MRYRSPSVFSLGGWSPLLPTGFLVSCGTLDQARLRLNFAYGIVTLFDPTFQWVLLSVLLPFLASPQPQTTVVIWFGLLPVRSPLLRKSFLLSFPPGT